MYIPGKQVHDCGKKTYIYIYCSKNRFDSCPKLLANSFLYVQFFLLLHENCKYGVEKKSEKPYVSIIVYFRNGRTLKFNLGILMQSTFLNCMTPFISFYFHRVWFFCYIPYKSPILGQLLGLKTPANSRFEPYDPWDMVN